MKATELLLAGELFRCLPDDALGSLAAHSEVRHLEAGEILVRAGAQHRAVVYLAMGAVALYRRSPDGDVTLLLGIVEGPSLFGDAECAAGAPWICSARAEEPSWCVLVPNQVYLALVDAHPALASRVYRDASKRHLLANHTAQTLALYDVRTRVLRLLLDYGHRFGRREGDRLIIDRTISKIALAGAVGVNRKTVTRTLQPLEKSGAIAFGDSMVVITGLEQLERSLPKDLFGLSSRIGEPALPLTARWADEEGA